MRKLLSLIVPVFNEEDVIDVSFARMDAAMRALPYEYEIIYVNDGSRDTTMAHLRSIAAENPQVRVLSFSRNFGHQLAVTAGMDAARGDALVIIDVDLQDPPEIIAELVKAWESGADIAYGKRLKREGETIFKKFTAFCYYRLLSAMSAYPIPLDTGDFRLLDRKVADVFLRMREHNRFLRGMSGWMGFTAVPVEYVRHERYAGSTKYTLKRCSNSPLTESSAFRTGRLRLWAGWAARCALFRLQALSRSSYARRPSAVRPGFGRCAALRCSTARSSLPLVCRART